MSAARTSCDAGRPEGAAAAARTGRDTVSGHDDAAEDDPDPGEPPPPVLRAAPAPQAPAAARFPATGRAIYVPVVAGVG